MKQTSTIRILAVLALLAMSGLDAQAQPWKDLPPMPTPRAYSTASVVDGKIYVIGGAYSQLESSDVVEMFDPADSSWHALPPLPNPIAGAASVAIGGKIYVVGGMEQNPLNILYVYDPADSSWAEKESMPTARGFLAASEWNGKLYAIGGTTIFPTRVNTVEMYDPAGETWETKTSMLTARSGFCAETFDGSIYAMGGVSESQFYDALEVYDPIGNSWSFREEMPLTRWGFGSGVTDHAIFAFGGGLDGVNANMTTVSYNPESNSWKFVQSMPEAHVACASAEIDSCVYAIGGALWPYWTGGAGDKVTGNVLRYCDTTVSVKEQETNPLSVSLSQNTPNPFSTQTTIAYELKKSANVSIQVFDLNGQTVTTLFKGRQEAGEHSATWDASGIAAGVYFYRLETDEGVLMRKCILQNP
jgi:hypothetical protein